MEKINLLNDVAFKILLGQKGRERALGFFINAFLFNKGEEPVKDIEILNEVQLTRENVRDKLGILDVRARSLDGQRVINIEIQLKDSDNMFNRSTFYGSKLLTEQTVIQRGDNYEDMARVLTINLLGYREPTFLGEHFHRRYALVDLETGKDIRDNVLMHFIELPKFRKLRKFDLDNPLHQWLLYIDEKTDDTLKSEVIHMNEGIRLTAEATAKMEASPEEMELYRLREKYERDTRSSQIYFHRKGRQEGLVEGREEGRKKGHEETLAFVVKNMMKSGFSFEEAITLSGATPEQQLQLQYLSNSE